MSDKVVSCNECEQDFTMPKLKRKVHQDLIYEFYFHCSHCNHKYISYYTNKKIRRDINRQKKRWKKYQQMSTPDAERKLLAQIKMEDKLIKKDMDGLHSKMQKVIT